jgi:rubrerythrin
MKTDELIMLYALIPVVAIIGYYFYFAKRRKQFTKPVTTEKIFRCVNCKMVYTDDEDVDLSPCPNCGTTNEEFKF